ncbi:MAG: hypothetical protein IJD28_05355 [Deferribacterales bacterium]|nr:hypothetical protein [Deferribacterales bacterium]
MFKKAKHLYAWYLRTFGYVAIVNPFSGVCHVAEKNFPPTEPLKAHEETHFRQIKEHGAVMFTIKYLWYLLIYGYENNPFEREAKQRQMEVLRKYI